MDMKRIIAIFLSLLMIFSVVGCSAKEQPAGKNDNVGNTASVDEPYTPPSIADLGITGYDGFCDVLSAKLIDGSENSNLSPISVYLALAMVAEGAKGETQTAMLALLGCTTLEELRGICGEMLEQLSVDTEDSTLAIADSIWMADRNGTLKFSDDYLQVLGETYRSEANAVDFGKEETSKQIAEWITEHTRGKIKISEDAMKFDPETIAVLINTIYLKDAWRDAFYEGATEKGTFYTPDGEMTVDYMKRKDDGVTIYQGDGYMRYSLPLLRVGRMTFVLPDEGMDFADILGTPEQMHMLLHGVNGKEIRANVSVKLPKFKFQDRFDLNDTLEALGIGIAFSGSADFSGMGNFDAKISRVLQESFIGVDEKGVEAAAYTMVAMGEAAMMPEDLPEIDFFLTRPFLYAIEANDGTVLFIGSVTTPDPAGSSTTTEQSSYLGVLSESEKQEILEFAKGWYAENFPNYNDLVFEFAKDSAFGYTQYPQYKPGEMIILRVTSEKSFSGSVRSCFIKITDSGYEVFNEGF
jgi:serpin B